MKAAGKDEDMDHPHIDDEKIVDRYLAGRLAADDEARFEAHLFTCTACLEQVESGEDLRRGLQAVAAQDAAQATVALGLMVWLRRRPVALAGLAALALALVLLPALLLRQQMVLRDALRRAEASTQAALRVPHGLTTPLADFLQVSLGAVRDDASEMEIRLDPGKEAVLLALELPLSSAARFRVSLYDNAGTQLWRGDDLTPNLYDTLLIVLPTSFLQPGDYRITVEAQAVADSQPVTEMRLRILE